MPKTILLSDLSLLQSLIKEVYVKVIPSGKNLMEKDNVGKNVYHIAEALNDFLADRKIYGEIFTTEKYPDRRSAGLERHITNAMTRGVISMTDETVEYLSFYLIGVKDPNYSFEKFNSKAYHLVMWETYKKSKLEQNQFPKQDELKNSPSSFDGVQEQLLEIQNSNLKLTLEKLTHDLEHIRKELIDLQIENATLKLTLENLKQTIEFARKQFYLI